MRRTSVLAALVLAAVLTVVGGVQNMALAVGACSAGQFCGWTDANWTGTKLAWSNTGQACTNIVSTYDNKLSSVVNRSGEMTQLRDNDSCGGVWYGTPNGKSHQTLSGTGMNDSANSIDFDMSSP